MNIVRWSMVAAALVIAAPVSAAPIPVTISCGQRPPDNRPGSWCSVDGPHVRVWWSLPSIGSAANGDEPTARLVSNEVEGRLWSLYEGLLGRTPLSDGDASLYWSNGGDGRYDIVLVNNIAGPRGASPSLFSFIRSAPPAKYSLVKAPVPQAQLFAAVAHELMHGFLSAFRCTGKCDWLGEATATWAEHFAYPQTNTEHQLASAFFDKPSRSLDDRPTPTDLHQYGAYVFLLFLQNRDRYIVGSRTEFVRRIWQATEQYSDPLLALDATLPGGFKGLWPEFVIDNWNATPITAANRFTGAVLPIYSYWDGLADGVFSRNSFTSVAVTAGPGGGVEIPLQVSLPRLSAAYYVFDFSSQDVRSVRLVQNLYDLQLKGVQGAEVIIFTRVRGIGWRRVSNIASGNVIGFCRDKSNENLEQMLVILANSDPRSTSPIDFVGLADPPKLVASTSGCLTGSEGFQECRFEIHNLAGDNNIYSHVETQTWEITGSPALGRYDYRWTTNFDGEASNTDASWWWANWARTGSSAGPGQVEVLLEQNAGVWERVVRRITPSPPLLVATIGRQAAMTMQGWSPIDQGAGEMSFPKRRAPTTASRIEGTSITTINYAAPPPNAPPQPTMPGEGQPDYPLVTTSCRWSWPGN